MVPDASTWITVTTRRIDVSIVGVEEEEEEEEEVVEEGL